MTDRTTRRPARRRRVRPDPASTVELRDDQQPAGRVLDARLHLLDRLVLDRDGEPVTTVADLEVCAPDGGDPVGATEASVTDLLAGPVLGTRIFGGRPPASRWHRLPWADVTEVGTAVRVSGVADDREVTWTERWVRDRVVGRIPGGRHAPK